MGRKTVKRHLGRLLALKLVTDTVIVYRIVREIESAEAFGLLELFLPKDLLEKVRKLMMKRPDFGFCRSGRRVYSGGYSPVSS
jgi:hypothetical protein